MSTSTVYNTQIQLSMRYEKKLEAVVKSATISRDSVKVSTGPAQSKKGAAKQPCEMSFSQGSYSVLTQIEATGIEALQKKSIFSNTRLHLHLTNQCNLRCPHCYMASGAAYDDEPSNSVVRGPGVFEQALKAIDLLISHHIYVKIAVTAPYSPPVKKQALKCLKHIFIFGISGQKKALPRRGRYGFIMLR